MAIYQDLVDFSKTQQKGIKSLFVDMGKIHAKGKFNIIWGKSLWVRVLNYLCRFPKPGKALPIRLNILRERHQEKWQREFSGRKFNSLQYKFKDRWIAERFGLCEFIFQPDYKDGVLNHVQECCCLRLGPFRFRLPSWLSPQTTGFTSSHGLEGLLNVSVELRLPWSGFLMAYEGSLKVEQ